MSNNSSPPPAPDYSPMMAGFAQIAATSAQNSENALAWAREQAAGNKDLLKTVNDNLLDITAASTKQAADQAAQSKALADRSSSALDASQKLIDEGTGALRTNLQKYTDPARKQADMGAAAANVAQNFDAARTASTQELEGYGINPSATRFAALDLGLRAQKAAAMASASNIASRQNDQLADGALDKLVAQGNLTAAQAAQLAQLGFTAGGAANQSNSTGASAGASALSGGLSTTASGANTLGTGAQWTGIGAGAQTGAGNLTSSMYNAQTDAYKAQNSASSGIGSVLGLGASMLGSGGAFGTGGALASGGALAFLEEGGMMPGATEGGAVPIEASPSRGAIPDDINAKINAGEFVMPKDVTSWYGEEKMQKMIQKAREAKAQATAKPRSAIPTGPMPTQPDFVSRPTGGALAA